MKKFLFIFLVFSFLWIAASGVRALTAFPIVIDFDLAPGSAQEKKITIINEEKTHARVLPTLFRVAQTNENGFPQIEAGSPNDPFVRMVSFPRGTEYVLAPGEKKEIPIRVSAGSDMKAGGYYGVISWGSVLTSRDISLSGQPGTNVAINIKGAVTEGARVAFFSPVKNAGSKDDFSTLFQIGIENTGGRHFVPSGSVEIRNIFNRRVAVLPLRSRKDGTTMEGARVLPGTTRTLFARWDKIIAFGPYRAILTVDAQGAGIVSAETSFFRYSRSATIGMFFIILCLIIALIKIILHRNKNEAI